MKFFKYLFFFSFILLCSNAYSAAYQAKVNIFGEVVSSWKSTQKLACEDLIGKKGITSVSQQYNTCRAFVGSTSYSGIIVYDASKNPDECWHPDYKIVTQSITGQIKKSICVPNNGVMCKYTSSTINDAPIVNGSITTTFSSVSKTPDPDCKEDLLNPPCDPTDPYGGCYTPPNQECTRQHNGSIVCPENKEPPIEQGCNGADYCKRPPQGCGLGYVSGTYNGERICIKTKPSSGDGSDGGGSDGGGSDGGGSDGGGSDGGGSDGGGSDGGGSDGGGSDGSDGADGVDGADGKDVDSSGIIAAINKLRDSLTHYSNEIIESIDSMSKKITGKIDDSNVHLDQIEANTLATKNNTDTTNQLLQDIKDKIPTGSNPENPPTGDGVDLTETNSILNDIKDWLTEEPDTSSLEADIPTKELTSQSFKTNLFGSSAQCPADVTLSLPGFSGFSKTFSFADWCYYLSLFGNFILIAAYCMGAYIIVSKS